MRSVQQSHLRVELDSETWIIVAGRTATRSWAGRIILRGFSMPKVASARLCCVFTNSDHAIINWTRIGALREFGFSYAMESKPEPLWNESWFYVVRLKGGL